MEARQSDPVLPSSRIEAPPSSRRAAVKARAPRDRGRIVPPPPSSAVRSGKVPAVHMASLVTTAQNWPIVPNPSSKPTVSEAVEAAAARSPRMSIDVELDFDGPESLPPVVLTFGPPPKPIAPPPPVAVREASEPVAAQSYSVIADPAHVEVASTLEPRRRWPVGVSLLCLLSVVGAVAIVALKL